MSNDKVEATFHGSAAYEQGYRDGTSSGYADWKMAFDEVIWGADVDLDSPGAVAEWVGKNLRDETETKEDEFDPDTLNHRFTCFACPAYIATNNINELITFANQHSDKAHAAAEAGGPS